MNTETTPKTKAAWTDMSNVIAFIAAGISVLALFSSIRSCQISEEALSLSKADFLASRSLVLKGTLAESKDAFVLSPIDPAFGLQSVQSRFPNALGGGARPSLPPDFVLYLPTQISKLKDFLALRVPAKDGVIKLSLESQVPFIVESAATTKGGLLKDQSLYAFVYGFSVFDDQVEIRPLGISFVRRLNPNEDPALILEAVWKDAIKQ